MGQHLSSLVAVAVAIFVLMAAAPQPSAAVPFAATGWRPEVPDDPCLFSEFIRDL